MGCRFFWRNLSCTGTLADSSLLLPALSKEWGEHTLPDVGPEGEEGSCCLLTRDDLSGRPEVLQPLCTDVQMKDRSSNHGHPFFAVELLLDHSKGPKSDTQDSLHREETERLTSVYRRDGKSEECQRMGTLLSTLPTPEGQWGKVRLSGKLWKRAVVSVLQAPPPVFANISWLEKSLGIYGTEVKSGTGCQGLSLARTQKNPPFLPLLSPF